MQISDLHFDKFPTPATFACWKIRFKTEVCTCSQFPTEAMQWIKEVELVDSVDELRSSSSIRGVPMPNVEVLDARIASALNKIIHNSHFKRIISLEEQMAQKEDRFLRGRQIAYLIYEQFRVTGTDDSVENYTDLFTIALRNDDIQEFDSKWDGILLSMTKIPHDDILEGLYKLRIRESEKVKTGLELYDLETQKKLGLDYHRFKTMVKRSIEFLRSVNQDNSQFWVRISYGTVKYVIDSIQDNTEILAQEERVHKQASRLVQPDQRQEQNHNRESSLVQKQPYQHMKEDGSTLIHQIKILPRTISRRKSSIFFDIIKRHRGKTMEQLNFTKSNSIFEIIIHKYSIGLTIDGKLVWLQEEVRKEDISIALLIRERFSTSVLFKDILEAISLIQRYRTMW